MEIKYKNKTQKRYLAELNKFVKSGKDIYKYVDENVKDKKELSKLNCSLKMIDFKDKRKVLRYIEKQFDVKKRYQKEPEEQFKLRNALNGINRLKNDRLKLAYRLQFISGLRVSEISKLKIDDIEVDENNVLIINVKRGKGDKNRVVKCLADKWLLDKLIELEPRKNGKLFYSESHLMGNAKKFHTHDLRKSFSQIKYFNNTSSEAVEELQEDLGHNKNSKTYLKYINRDVNLNNTKWDNIEPY